jgi:hypothetical protein
MGEDKRFDMMKTFKERQDKFMYYLIGLNVALIGFSISKSFEIKIKAFQSIFFGIAIFCWSVSIAIAFSWILNQFRSMVKNMDSLDLINGHYDKNQISEIEKNKQLNTNYKELMNISKKGESKMKSTLFCFLGGVVFYMLWGVFHYFNYNLY